MPRKHAPKILARRLALLICNGTFPNIPQYQLPGPVKDAKLLSATLSDPETCGFEVKTLVDRGLLEIRREIARICKEAGEQDTLLIYYSGNGFPDDDGDLYLLASDSYGDYPDATALDAEYILSQLRHSKCRKIVLMVDACHAGAFFNHNRGIPPGLFAITSCGADEYCSDTPDGGAFTLATCAGLRGAAADLDGDGQVSIDELHEFVKNDIKTKGFSGIPQKWVWNVPEPIYIGNVPRCVFLSYAREDAELVDELGKALTTEGLSIWVDREDIQSGSWKERVTAGLNRARALVVLLTEHSLASSPVQKELAFAARKKVPIIPVQTRALEDHDLPDWFTLDYADLHRHLILPNKIADGVKGLARAIRQARGGRGTGG